ncbi:hypothetical protein GCM10025857_20080 [Alicyclobacillus contaminans]|nr:hypothetical protein GCM10025857_20080 [Alicyclobacillus contaminans]
MVGANGAGKSTVVKILSGSIAKDAGQMEFEGKAVEITSQRMPKPWASPRSTKKWTRCSYPL